MEILAERGDDLLGDDGDVLAPADVGNQHHEFVATEARDDIRIAEAGQQAARDLDQQMVTDLVAVGVVDWLETVEVDEHHGKARVGAARAPDAALREVGKQHAVWQAGELVVRGQHVGGVAFGLDLLEQRGVAVLDREQMVLEPLMAQQGTDERQQQGEGQRAERDKERDARAVAVALVADHVADRAADMYAERCIAEITKCVDARTSAFAGWCAGARRGLGLAGVVAEASQNLAAAVGERDLAAVAELAAVERIQRTGEVDNGDDAVAPVRAGGLGAEEQRLLPATVGRAVIAANERGLWPLQTFDDGGLGVAADVARGVGQPGLRRDGRSENQRSCVIELP